MSAETTLHEQFARIGKALSSPARVALLDRLCQGERSVEGLARAAGLTVANASQHLQRLKAAGLAESRRDGARVVYRVAGDDVCAFFLTLRNLAHGRLAEVERLVRDAIEARDLLEPLGREELLARAGDIVLLDVRPREEYLAGHLPGAVSIPLEELAAHLDSLPRDREIVAYCRGPYCLLAPRAVELLHATGLRARRLEDGLPEWRHAGLPVAVGERGDT